MTAGHDAPLHPARPTGPNAEHALPTSFYAGLVTRAVALAIDALALTIVVSVLTAAIGLIISLFTTVDTSSAWAVLGTLGSWAVVVATYFTLCWAAGGQTLGQRMMGIRVLRVNLKPVGLLRAYARFLALSVCMGPLILGQLLVLFTPRRRALHDLMVRTVVVYTDVEADEQAGADGRSEHAASDATAADAG